MSCVRLRESLQLIKMQRMGWLSLLGKNTDQAVFKQAVFKQGWSRRWPFLGLVFGLAALLVSCSSPGQMLPISAQTEIGGQIIQLEVAVTQQQQALGLMYRTELADNRGMLFPFAPARPVGFWMKNVSISLDMIFLFQGSVVAIAADVPPCPAAPCPTYGPEDRHIVDQVIELRGGRAAELGIQVGDVVTINPLEPATSAPQ